MDILKFTLSGRTAFFKKPEVNSYYYFTFGCIHKVALLGIFGAILGLEGYAQNKKKKEYPEFYRDLNHVKVAVKFNTPEAYIPKKIQVYNNTVGYASKEAGGILNVKEQWLENPSWDIYVQVNDDITRKLADYLLSKKAVFVPYLGKNDHLADIKDVKLFENMAPSEEFHNIDSIMEKEKTEFYTFDDFQDEIEELDLEEEDAFVYRYEEFLPVSLSEEMQLYESKDFVATNLWVRKYGDAVYEVEGHHIVFF